MIISARERIILQFLVSNIDKDVTIKELADTIHVSERTVHRDLKNVEEILDSFHIKLNKKIGVGVRILGSLNDIHLLKISLLKQDYTEYTPEERILVALCTLLDNKEPIKLFSLAKELGVTTATVSNDLDKLEPIIDKYNLTLLRKRGYGVELVGSEEDKRKAIRSLLSDRFDVPEFLQMVKENIQKKSTNKIDSISERLLGLVQKEKLIKIENIIEDINEQLPYPLADSSYVGLVVHIALALERIQRGENIILQKDYMEELSQTREFEFAKTIAWRLERTFSIPIPEQEIGYITMHLRGAKIRFDNSVGIKDENLEIALLVKQLIDRVEILLNTKFLDDSLFKGLLAHLQPTLYRLEKKMRISNPLLPEIKKDYPELFEIVKKAAEQTLTNIDIPDEEVGYLVLHFGSSINNTEISKDLSVLIICSSGIGTSKMLAAKIVSQIPSLKEVKTASVFELKNISIEGYDVIFSTIPLEDIKQEYLLVNPILSDQDLEEVKSYLKKKSGKKPKNVQPEYFQENSNVVRDFRDLEKIAKRTQSLTDILGNLSVWSFHEENGDMEKSLKLALKELQHEGKIVSEKDVYNALIERADLGGLAIPETSLALFHTTHGTVHDPSFNIIELNEMVSLKAMNGDNEVVKRILLLLAPMNADRQVMEVLSFISALIIQSPKSIELFKYGSKEELMNFISNEFFKNMV
ncbi:BglG family transcription antiterminator [Bacillus sp. B1-b2]|uniref:BglG family transcription antiterminator n=1 Tax=Bacillus sp. B1-b2 TaxID=2653201 RepID=UPI0012628523|nr:BglG family transcription antiterminator [Bacillus sp. B1-b2]KAB7668828.1 transcription antiterminator [Bacillus sp. B1-b2]